MKKKKHTGKLQCQISQVNTEMKSKMENTLVDSNKLLLRTQNVLDTVLRTR